MTLTPEEALKYHCQSHQAFVETLRDGDEDNNPFDEAFRMAIAALRKQTPKMVEIKKGVGGWFGRCECEPNCYINLEMPQYCRNCGQYLMGVKVNCRREMDGQIKMGG